MGTRVRRQAGGPRETHGTWTPKCGFGMPGLPDVQKQVEEMRVFLASLDRHSKLNSVGTLGRAGGFESLTARIGEAPGGKTVSGRLASISRPVIREQSKPLMMEPAQPPCLKGSRV